jgi:uncharacterized membrane protein YGL010W
MNITLAFTGLDELAALTLLHLKADVAGAHHLEVAALVLYLTLFVQFTRAVRHGKLSLLLWRLFGSLAHGAKAVNVYVRADIFVCGAVLRRCPVSWNLRTFSQTKRSCRTCTCRRSNAKSGGNYEW